MSDRSAKNFSISSRRASVRLGIAVLLLALLTAAPGLAKKKKKGPQKPTDPSELFNPLLGIDYSHWLVGAMAQIATLEEIETYLTLASDADAKQFIEAFWTKRAEGVGPFDKKPHQIFEQRAEEADKRFSEGTFPGRRTHRGAIYITYGEPESTEYETPRSFDDPTTELWLYPADAPPGLDGEVPRKEYRFVEIDGSWVFYTGQKVRLSPIEKERMRSRY